MCHGVMPCTKPHDVEPMTRRVAEVVVSEDAAGSEAQLTELRKQDTAPDGFRDRLMCGRLPGNAPRLKVVTAFRARDVAGWGCSLEWG